MQADQQESALPYTATNTGRRARVGYLGFDGIGFEALWPLFAGLVLSIGLGLRFFLGAESAAGHWPAKTVVALLPFFAGYSYLRFLVQGRPPHFKGDLLEAVIAARLDFSDPPLRAFPLLPRVVAREAGPARAADQRHPMEEARRRSAA
jgi:hypothetical protein